YFYHTVARYVAREGRPPVRAILEVGVNVGAVTRELAEAFPLATILGYEALPQLAAGTKDDLADCPRKTVRLGDIRGLHLFCADLREQPGPAPTPVICYEALPSGGAGWRGGSWVGPVGAHHSGHYRPLPDHIPALTLDEAIHELLALIGHGESQVDFLKTDC